MSPPTTEDPTATATLGEEDSEAVPEETAEGAHAPDVLPETRAEEVEVPPEREAAGLPEAVEETLGPQAKEMYASLTPESRGFVARIFEKASDVMDRARVWRNERFHGRAAKGIESLRAQRESRERDMRDASSAAERTRGLLDATIKKLDAAGYKMSEAVTAKKEDEIRAFESRAASHGESIRDLDETIAGVTREQESYRAKVEEASGRIAGRLEAKIQANNQTLESLQKTNERKDLEAKLQRDQIAGLEGHVKELSSFAEALDKDLRGEVENALKQLRHEQREREQVVRALDKETADLASEIKKITAKNDTLKTRQKAFTPGDTQAIETLRETDQRSAPAPAGGGERIEGETAESREKPETLNSLLTEWNEFIVREKIPERYRIRPKDIRFRSRVGELEVPLANQEDARRALTRAVTEQAETVERARVKANSVLLGGLTQELQRRIEQTVTKFFAQRETRGNST